MEPGFGLLDQLLSLEVLTRPELADVRSERTVYRKNAALLDLLTTEEQCNKFLNALQLTGQQHVVNYITQNGGQNDNDVKLTLLVKCRKHNNSNKKAVLSQGNRAMPQLFFSV